MADLHIVRAHTLGLAAARKIANTWVEQVESEFGMKCTIEERSQDNMVTFVRSGVNGTLHVTKDTPPCFIFHTFEDQTVPMENSLEFAAALRRAGVPFDLHIYQKGQHGMGLGHRPYTPGDEAALHPWTRDCIFWLKTQGFLK